MLFLTCSWRFLISKKIEQSQFKLGKIIGIEKHAGKRFMVVDSSFLSSLLGFDLILRFSVTFVGGGGFPAEPQTGGVYCGSTPSCECRSNAQGTDCICEGDCN